MIREVILTLKVSEEEDCQDRVKDLMKSKSIALRGYFYEVSKVRIICGHKETEVPYEKAR